MATLNGNSPNETGDNKLNVKNLSESGSEAEIDIHYEPILPEVEVSTNEEDEDVMLKLRARLYRFDYSEPNSPEWKERGTGEVKLLHHRDRHTVRIVMRREKTFKVCANHFITPFIDLKPSAGSEKAWVYKVPADFADELAKEECLAIKFANVEYANQFKDTFYEAKEIIKTKCCLYAEDNDHNASEDSSGSEAEIEDNDKSDTEIESEKVADKLSELTVNK